jgi:hypothetical protein
MRSFKDYIKKELNESIGIETISRTKVLVQSVYTHYADYYSKNQPEVVGWMDGSSNALIRNQKIYEAGIKNKKAIDLIDENINTMCGTIDGLPDFMKYDWIIASGVFNVGLKEEHTKWTIENMIKVAKKGVIFNMLSAPYIDDNYVSYVPEEIKKWLENFDHRQINIIEDYMKDDAEFTVYFYI